MGAESTAIAAASAIWLAPLPPQRLPPASGPYTLPACPPACLPTACCCSWLEAGGAAVQKVLQRERRYAEGWLQRSAPLAQRLEREMLGLVLTSQVCTQTKAPRAKQHTRWSSSNTVGAPAPVGLNLQAFVPSCA